MTRAQLAPGIHLVGTNVEFDVPAIMAHFHVPDTPENREHVAECALNAVQRIYGPGPVTIHRARQ